MKGYFKVVGKCQRCYHKIIVILIMVAVFIAWYLLNSVFSRSIVSFGVILNWVQLANVIGDLPLRWPHNLLVVYSIANVMDFDVDMVEPSCLGIDWTFTHNFIVQMLLPILLSGSSVAVYWTNKVIFHWEKRASNSNVKHDLKGISWLWKIPDTDKEWEERWDRVISGMLSSLEVMYLTIARYCANALNCRRIAGVSVLRAAPEIECDSEERRMLLALGFIGFSVYVVGYVGFVIYILNHLRVPPTFSDAKNMRRYGILYAHYEIDYWWNEIIILFRRLLFVIIFTLGDSPANQVAMLALIVVASLVVHVYTTPYVHTSVDILFTSLLATLMAQAFSGLLFHNPDVSGRSKRILDTLVLAVIAVLWLVFLFFFGWELLRKYRINVMQQFHKKVLVEEAASARLLDGNWQEEKKKEQVTLIQAAYSWQNSLASITTIEMEYLYL